MQIEYFAINSDNKDYIYPMSDGGIAFGLAASVDAPPKPSSAVDINESEATICVATLIFAMVNEENESIKEKYKNMSIKFIQICAEKSGEANCMKNIENLNIVIASDTLKELKDVVKWCEGLDKKF